MAFSRLAWRPKLSLFCPKPSRFASTGTLQQTHVQKKSDRVAARQDAPAQRKAGSAGHEQQAHVQKKSDRVAARQDAPAQRRAGLAGHEQDKSHHKPESQRGPVSKAAHFTKPRQDVERQNRQTPNPERRQMPARDLTPVPLSQFIRQGQLQTTPESADFIRKYDLEWSTRTGFNLRLDPEIRKMMQRHLVASWSPRNVIHPLHVKYFISRPDPISPMVRHRYACMKLTQALWVYVIPFNRASPVVRYTVRRTLKKAILDNLDKLGYPHGNGKKREIRGTLWITDSSSTDSAHLPLRLIGKRLAKLLVEQHSTERRPDGSRAPE